MINMSITIVVYILHYIRTMKAEKPKDYIQIHTWIKTKYGRASKCEHCKIENKKRYEWALKKGYEYEKNIDNYFELCVSCHRIYDYTEEMKKDCGLRMSTQYKTGKRKSPKVNEGKTGKDSISAKVVIQLSISGDYIQEFGSVKEAAIAIGGKYSNICMCARGTNLTAYGYKWKYKYNKRNER